MDAAAFDRGYGPNGFYLPERIFFLNSANKIDDGTYQRGYFPEKRGLPITRIEIQVEEDDVREGGSSSDKIAGHYLEDIQVPPDGIYGTVTKEVNFGGETTQTGSDLPIEVGFRFNLQYTIKPVAVLE